MSAAALFHPEGDGVFRPSALTRGPWSRDAQHGGPVAALLAGALAGADGGDGRALVRLTYELLRPVPLTPIRVEVGAPTGGRAVDRVDARAVDAATGEPLATVRALRIRRKPVAVPEQPDEPAPPGPDGLPVWDERFLDDTAFVHDGMELRFSAGGFVRPGPATVWFRLRVPVVAGRTPSGVERAAAAADFGNGISSVADMRSLLFVNPDLTVALHREPRGEWVALESRSRLEPDGIGGAESALYDSAGRCGRAYQTLLVAAR